MLFLEMKIRNSIIISILILLFCNIMVVNAEIETNYFSPKLKKGKVLEWEESNNFFTPEIENETYLVEIEIIQDIPDFAIDHDFLYRYFNLTINGTLVEERYIITALIPRYILPIKYVEGLSIISLYEHYLNISGEYQDYSVEQNEGDIVVNGTRVGNATYLQFELIVHEKTGIVKYRKTQYIFSEFNFIIEVIFLGGINLINTDFTVVLFVLIEMPLIIKLARSKKKEKSTSLG